MIVLYPPCETERTQFRSRIGKSGRHRSTTMPGGAFHESSSSTESARLGPQISRQTFSFRRLSGLAAMAARSRGSPTAPPPTETTTSPRPELPVPRQRVGVRRVHDVAGIGERVAECGGLRQRRVQRQHARVAVHEHLVEPRAGQRDHLLGSLGIVLAHQDVADGRDDPGRAGGGARGLEQGHELEAELTAAEGELFHQQNIGIDGLERVQQPRRPAVPPGVVDGLAMFVQQRLESLVGGASGWQENAGAAFEVHALDLRPAKRHRHVEAGRCHRPGDQRCPLEMTHTQQMLNVEHDPFAHPSAPSGLSNRFRVLSRMPAAAPMS